MNIRMKALLWTLLFASVSASSTTGGQGYACNLMALTRAERASHAKMSEILMAAVEARRELPNGYAFRLPRGRLVDAAQWVALESKCCPFFGFSLEAAKDGGPLWLSVTGGADIKPFIKAEFGLGS